MSNSSLKRFISFVSLKTGELVVVWGCDLSVELPFDHQVSRSKAYVF